MKYLKNLRISTVMPLLFLLIISSCRKDKNTTTRSVPVSDADLRALPKDQGGSHTAVYLSSNTLYGYYVYTPSGFSTNQVSYPLLVFLHGAGEVGNSMITPGELQRLLVHGPPELINNKNWSPTYPMVVVSPQETGRRFDPDSLQSFIKSIISQYRINTHRIYLTGLSMGGISAYKYISVYAKTGYVAAAVPLSVRFDPTNFPDTANLVNFPIWSFSGGNDIGVNDCIGIVNEINKYKPTLKAKVTIFPGIGHDCWDLVYAGTGMGTESSSYDPFKMSIYDWMFQYAR